ncbi:zinc-binding dehydrogenase [Nocardia salmonicida]|uniref:zinc-binding dehydrogenase n=1 Tax=Nocardia salmonicida TaxID=53431 RepID=UPI000B27B800|nr:zinc-binding dehydrogenase [Nocardia salmonicida]
MRARAVVLETFGVEPSLREFTVPEPDAGELLIACTYGGVCGTDLHLQQGHLPIPLPMILGHEGLGIVNKVGGSVKDALGEPLSAGDRVMWASSIACGTCVPCRQYREPTLCEIRRTYGVNRAALEEDSLVGAWAEYIRLHSGAVVVKVPDTIDDLTAMSFACAGPTMVHALFERRPVRLGETVVVQGSGPVGLAAAAFAQLAGARQVIVVGGPAGRLEKAKQCGIGDHHIDIIDQGPEATARQVGELAPEGADLVIECTGVPEAIAQGIGFARRGGAYLIVGQYTDAGPTTINPHHIVRQQLDVMGSWAFSGAHLVEYVRILPALASRFDLSALVTTYPLNEYTDAMTAVGQGRVLKAVLTTGWSAGLRAR